MEWPTEILGFLLTQLVLQECGDVVYWCYPISASTWQYCKQLWSTLKLRSAVIELKRIGRLLLMVVLVAGSVRGRLIFLFFSWFRPSDRPVHS